MGNDYKFKFGAFAEKDTPKAQALKPLEEAAEVFGAWQMGTFTDILDECMDVVQAVVNLLDAECFTQEDVDEAIERCNERNRDRGRL